MGVSTLHLLVVLAILGCMATGTTGQECTDNTPCTGSGGKEYCKPGKGTRNCDCKPGYIGGAQSCAVCTTPASCGGTFAAGCADPAGGNEKTCTCKVGYIFQTDGTCGECTDADSCGGTTLGECKGSTGQMMCECKSGYLADFTLGCIECRAKGDCASKGDRTQCDTGSQMCVAFSAKITTQNHVDVTGSSVQVKDVSATMTLTCTAGPVTTGALTYLWTLDDGAALPTGITATLGSLEIIDPKAHAGKTIKCKASKTADTSGAVAEKSVLVTLTLGPAKPTLTANPATGTFDENASVTLSCSTTTAAVTTYGYKKGGTTITGATGATHVIRNYDTATHGGIYTCEVTKTSETSTSDALILTAEAPAMPTVTANPATGKFAEGEEVTLTCATTTAGVTYAWEKDTSAIGSATDKKYVISKYATASNAGSYTCDVKKNGLTSKSAVLELKVKSGSTNLQMSYLMLGLVTLMSAVWTGRVW